MSQAVPSIIAQSWLWDNQIAVKKKSNVNLSFSEMRRLYSIKFKKAFAYRQRKNKEDMERVHERNFKNCIKFPSNFQFG